MVSIFFSTNEVSPAIRIFIPINDDRHRAMINDNTAREQ